MIELLFIRHGATEGNLRRRYIGRTDEPLCEAWVDAMCLTPIPDGESVADFKTRCCETFAETIQTVPDGSRVGFVVHGGVIMAILEAYARPKRDFYAYHIGNGECLQGVYDGETIRIKQ